MDSVINKIRINDTNIEIAGNVLIRGSISSGKTSLLKHIKENMGEDYNNLTLFELDDVNKLIPEDTNCIFVDNLVYKGDIVFDRLAEFSNKGIVVSVEYPNNYSTNEMILEYEIILNVDKSDVKVFYLKSGCVENVPFSLTSDLTCM